MRGGFRIRRPVKSWRSSSALFGGRCKLFFAIVRCYLGGHTWGATFFLPEGISGRSCLVCHKRLPGGIKARIASYPSSTSS